MKEKLVYIAYREKKMIHLLEYVIVSKGGYQVKVFSGAVDMLKEFHRKPDVVVIDKMIGLELKEKIHEVENEYEVPVIVLDPEVENGFIKMDDRKSALQCITTTDYFLDDFIRALDSVH